MFLALNRLKAVLINTARYMENQGTAMDQGAGRLDLVKAMDATAMLVTAGEPPAASHSFGVVGHSGNRGMVRQEFCVQALDSAGEPRCRLRVRWIRRPPGMRAYLSAAELGVHRNCSANFTMELRFNGTRVPDGTYFGLLEASTSRGVLRLPFAITPQSAGPSLPPQPPGPGGSPGSEPGSPRVPSPAPRPTARRPD